MISEKLLQNLSVDNLGLLDTFKLAEFREALVLDKLKGLVEDPYYELEPGKAKEFYEKLQRIYEQDKVNFDINSGTDGRFSLILWQVFWKAAPALDLKTIHFYLQRNLVFFLKSQIDIKSSLQKLFNFYEFGFGIDQEGRRGLLHILETNEERLGKDYIHLISGETVAPEIKNWIKDYISVVPRGNLQRGKLEEINYLNNNSNVKSLTPDEKDMLTRLIDIYDWLYTPLTSLATPYMSATTIPKASILHPPAPVGVPRPATPRPSRVLPPPPPPPPPAKPIVEEQVRPSSLTLSQPEEILHAPEPPTPANLVSPTPPRPKADLYRSTLDELRRMRQEAAAPRPIARPAPTPGAPPASRIISQETETPPPPPKVAPLPRVAPTPPGPPPPVSPAAAQRPPNLPVADESPISVNEALIRAGAVPPPGTPGQPAGEAGRVVPGDKEVDQKLQDLKQKNQPPPPGLNDQ